MKRGIMALEEQDPGTPSDAEVTPMSDDAVETQAELVEKDEEGVEAVIDQVEEADKIGQAVDTYTEQLSGAEPVGEETVKAIEVAVEHFRVRLGYSKRVIPAMEAFKADPMAAQKLALENLKELRVKLDSSIQVAQEGLGKRIVNAVERAFTSSNRVGKKAGEYATRIANNGTKDEEFPDAAWARVFAATGKQKIDGGDVLKMIKQYEGYRKVLTPLVKEGTELLHALGLAISKSTFIAKDEEVAKINTLCEQASKLRATISESHESVIHQKATVDVAALDAKVGIQIGKAVNELVRDTSFDKINEDFIHAYYRTLDEWGSNTDRRLIAGDAADLRAALRVYEIGIDRICDMLYAYERSEFHVVYGAYKYLKAAAI
jgi:hypothetical protein